MQTLTRSDALATVKRSHSSNSRVRSSKERVVKRSILRRMRIGVVGLLAGLATVLVAPAPAHAAPSTGAIAQCWNDSWWPFHDIVSFGAYGSGYQGYNLVRVWMALYHNGNQVAFREQIRSVNANGDWVTAYDEVDVGAATGPFQLNVFVNTYDGPVLIDIAGASCTM